LLTGDPNGAIQSFQRAIALDNSPIEEVWLARAMDKAGKHDEAHALLAQTVAQDPSMMQAAIDVERAVEKNVEKKEIPAASPR
jgi:predicted Zn-dependent protease